MPSFNSVSFIVFKLLDLEETLTKGHNSQINASRVMGDVSRIGLVLMNTYVKFEVNTCYSIKDTDLEKLKPRDIIHE